MYRVSTSQAFKMSSNTIMRAQSRQTEALTEFSSGKRATDLQGFGRDAEILIAARTVQARAKSFVEVQKMLAGRLEAQDQALTRVSDAATEARLQVISAIASGQAEPLATLNSIFAQAVDGLNWRHNGLYLFAGSQVDTPPVTVETLAALEDSPDVASVFSNDQTPTVSRLNEASAVTTGFLADAVGGEFFTIMKSIQAYDEGPSGPLKGKLSEAQIVFLKDRLQALTTAESNLLGRVSENGLIQERVDDALGAQIDRVGLLDIFIAENAEVDGAEAITKLKKAELGFQASVKALEALQTTNLLNLLQS